MSEMVQVTYTKYNKEDECKFPGYIKISSPDLIKSIFTSNEYLDELRETLSGAYISCIQLIKDERETKYPSAIRVFQLIDEDGDEVYENTRMYTPDKPLLVQEQVIIGTGTKGEQISERLSDQVIPKAVSKKLSPVREYVFAVSE